jgi:hypothetical protein
MFGFDFHTYLTDMMVFNGHLQILCYALPKDSSYLHRPLPFLRIGAVQPIILNPSFNSTDVSDFIV